MIGRRGFTLLEMMVATTIMGVAVVGPIKDQDRIAGRGTPVVSTYSRITFDRAYIRVQGHTSDATLMDPGHPLMAAMRYKGIASTVAAMDTTGEFWARGRERRQPRCDRIAMAEIHHRAWPTSWRRPRTLPPFWRRSLPLDVADRAAQIWVICALLPAWRHAAPMLGRAGELALSSGLCR